ncbi:hypothetical protein EDD28_0552 [Salana multivorans]|uniref:Uncharacterized protein n=1 Tax=Salana multivorans TaxID=120377 RepID=A0A3N2D8F0_9MICO|nr:hypothetical protein [Salana multivorans]ROR95982.1 hypothetical protein EDD28_0552 [Salana multivorans]
MRPMKYLGATGKRWTGRDRALAEGLEEYEASLNPVGIPSWIARDPSRRFTVDENVDRAMAVYEEAQEGIRKSDVDTPGLILAVLEVSSEVTAPSTTSTAPAG